MKFGDFRRKDNECLHHLYWYAMSAHSVLTPHTVQVWSIVYFRRGHAKCPLLDKRSSPHFLFYINPVVGGEAEAKGNIMKKVLIVLVTILLLTGCFATKTTLSRKVELGMTKEQVINICGEPYKQAARYDAEQNLQEVYYYKEKTWDDGGWSWSTTVTNHIFVFSNNILIAIDQGEEEHNKQQYNSVFIW